MRGPFRMTGILALAATAATAAMAASAQPDEADIWDRYPCDDVVIESSTVDITLRADGTATASYATTAVVLTEVGRDKLHEREFAYNAALSTLVVDEACVEQLDGQRTCTDAGDIVSEPQTGEPIIDGVHQMIRVMVPHDKVRIGSRLTLRYHLDMALPADLRLFDVIHAYDSGGPLERLDVTVRHPATRPVHGFVVGEASAERTEDGDAVVQRWTFGPQAAPPVTRDRPHLDEQYPALYLGEFQTWEELAAWYRPLLEQAAERFDGKGLREVKALADADMDRLDPALRAAFILDDRTPGPGIGVSQDTLVPGSMETVVSKAGTEIDRAVALWATMRDAGVEGAHVALATDQRVEIPPDVPCPLALTDAGVYVEGRGFVHPGDHADFIDTVYSDLRRGTVVAFAPEGPIVLHGDALDPPEDRPGWHREGRLTISAGELRVDETLRFAGSAAAAARSWFRRLQDDLSDDDKIDRRIKRLYASHMRKLPEDKTYRELSIYQFAEDRGYADGWVREATFFDPWDPTQPTEITLRYVPEDAIETVGGLTLVRLPLTVEDVSARCLTAPTDREAPLQTSTWDYSYDYAFEIPAGFRLVGLPQDQHISSEFAALELTFAEELLDPVVDDDDKGRDKDKDKGTEDDVAAGAQVPGVRIRAHYTIHDNRVALEDYPEFHRVAAIHALAFTDPIALEVVAD